MRKPPPRRFSLADLMVLVAAIAGGFALQRWAEAPIDWEIRKRVSSYRQIYFPAINWWDHLGFRTPAYYLWAATAAMVVLRWGWTRPSARRILWQPGAVACLAVVVATLYGFLLHEIRAGLWLDDPNDPVLLIGHGNAWDAAIHWAAPAVAGSWAALALRCRWRPERSWIDRLGRLLGIYWLAGDAIGQLFWPFFHLYLSIPMKF